MNNKVSAFNMKTILLSVFTMLLIGGCGSETADNTGDSSSSEEGFTAIAAPSSFDFSMSKEVNVSVTVLLPDGTPNASAAVFIYQDALVVSTPTDDALTSDEVDDSENDEVFADPSTLLVSGITNNAGTFSTVVNSEQAVDSLVITTSAIGIPNIAQVSIVDNAASVTFSAD